VLACSCAQKEWVEYLAYPCNDSICVCNLSITDSDKNFREKRFNHEVGSALWRMLRVPWTRVSVTFVAFVGC
jgi:hypothetical protein